jgi:hypothetical protein
MYRNIKNIENYKYKYFFYKFTMESFINITLNKPNNTYIKIKPIDNNINRYCYPSLRKNVLLKMPEDYTKRFAKSKI